MANFFLRSRPTVTWAASTAHVIGVRRLSTGTVPARGIHFEVTTAGTTGAAEPAWNTTVGGTTADGTVTWTTRGSANTWVASTAYVAGDRAVSTSAAAAADQVLVHECTTGGTSDATEPNWTNTVAGTTTDGTVTWTTREATTWDNSHIFIGRFTAAATSSIGAGDTLFIGDEHSETTAGSVGINIRGTSANPARVICVNDTGDPVSPSVLATTAIIANTTAANMSIVSAFSAYFFGINFSCTNAANTAFLVIGGSSAAGTSYIFDTCNLTLNTTSTSAQILLGSVSATTQGRTTVVFDNTTCTFGSVSQTLSPRICNLTWRNTNSSALLGTIPNVAITPAAQGQGCILLEGVNFSTIIPGKVLITAANGANDVVIRNCAGGGGGTIATATHPGADGGVYTAINIDSTGSSTAFQYTREFLVTTSSLTVIRNGGATNGSTPFAWQMAATNAQRTFSAMSFPIRKWNTILSPITVSVEILRDNVTALNNQEVWLEVEFQSSTSTPISSYSSNKGTLLGSSTAHPSSTASWVTTGLINPNRQKLSVTVTPAVIGLITGRVYLVGTTTIFVDPFLTVT